MTEQTYDKYLLAFSGGKDSLACLLDLIEKGIPTDRIELHHHDVDGREGSDLFDWASARAFGGARFERIAVYEIEFNHTIDNKLTVGEMADKGTAYRMDEDIINQAKGLAPLDCIISENWTLPAGAYGDSTGPT